MATSPRSLSAATLCPRIFNRSAYRCLRIFHLRDSADHVGVPSFSFRAEHGPRCATKEHPPILQAAAHGAEALCGRCGCEVLRYGEEPDRLPEVRHGLPSRITAARFSNRAKPALHT